MNKKKRAILTVVRDHGPLFALDIKRLTGQSWFLQNRLGELEDEGYIESKKVPASPELQDMGILHRRLYQVTHSGRRKLIELDHKEETSGWFWSGRGSRGFS